MTDSAHAIANPTLKAPVVQAQQELSLVPLRGPGPFDPKLNNGIIVKIGAEGAEFASQADPSAIFTDGAIWFAPKGTFSTHITFIFQSPAIIELQSDAQGLSFSPAVGGMQVGTVLVQKDTVSYPFAIITPAKRIDPQIVVTPINNL